MAGRPLLAAKSWIGTRGTVTALHSDASDNLLCQVSARVFATAPLALGA
jgi:hypothetical protein